MSILFDLKARQEQCFQMHDPAQFPECSLTKFSHSQIEIKEGGRAGVQAKQEECGGPPSGGCVVSLPGSPL